MTQENCTLLRDFFDVVWNDGEYDRVGEFLSSTYEIRHDPGDPWNGQTLTVEGFGERVKVSRAPFPDQRFDILEIFDGDDRVAVTWTWKATHKGDIPGFPATGKVIVMSGATVYYFEDGRISGHWQVADKLGVMQQLSARS